MSVLHQEIIHALNTDCVEFCPDGKHPDWLVLGSYQLDEKSGKRHGGLDLFRLQRGSGAPHLELAAQTRGLPGVFDARWHQLPSGWHISAALSDGMLHLYRPPIDLTTGDAAAADEGAPPADAEGAGVGASSSAGAAAPAASPPSGVLQLEEVDSCRAVSQMALCMDWASLGGGGSGAASKQQHVVAVSSSSGTVTLMQAGEGGLRRLNEWHAHDLEVWAVAFDKHQVGGVWMCMHVHRRVHVCVRVCVCVCVCVCACVHACT